MPMPQLLLMIRAPLAIRASQPALYTAPSLPRTIPSSGPGSPLSALMICAPKATPCIGPPSRLPAAIPPTWVPWAPSLPLEPTEGEPS
ncbi:hypothetical protein D3C78_1556580 [compost metagenome]